MLEWRAKSDIMGFGYEVLASLVEVENGERHIGECIQRFLLRVVE